jgi:hypothetical protein
MNSPYQYLMLSSPPEKRAKFAALKQQYGSFFAFHGSSMENWHAIMRQGLRNLSNTNLMTTGAGTKTKGFFTYIYFSVWRWYLSVTVK